MRFHTADLLSKSGFNDGGFFPDMSLYDRHKLLWDIINKHVLPKIENEIELVFVTGIHNPVRASVVDGEEVNWYFKSDIVIRPEYVDVEDEVIGWK